MRSRPTRCDPGPPSDSQRQILIFSRPENKLKMSLVIGVFGSARVRGFGQIVSKPTFRRPTHRSLRGSVRPNLHPAISKKPSRTGHPVSVVPCVL